LISLSQQSDSPNDFEGETRAIDIVMETEPGDVDFNALIPWLNQGDRRYCFSRDKNRRPRFFS
jgi:hypothetical protein